MPAAARASSSRFRRHRLPAMGTTLAVVLAGLTTASVLPSPASASSAPQALTAPVEHLTPGYTMLGWYPGAHSGQNAYSYQGGVLKATGDAPMGKLMTSLGSTLGTTIEAIDVGLPNTLGDVSPLIQDLSDFHGYVVGTLPLSIIGTDSSGHTGSLYDLVHTDKYDSAYTDIFTKLRNAGLNGNRMAIRLGWEWDGNWAWGLNGIDPATGHYNTAPNYVAAFQHVVRLARAAGWVGDFDWNGPAANSTITDGNKTVVPYSDMFPGNSFADGAQIVGYDFYSGISNAAWYYKVDSHGKQYFDSTGTYGYGYNKNGGDQNSGGTYQSVWAGEAQPHLDSVAQFARSHGMLMGLGEVGELIDHTSRYASNQTSLYWPLLTGWLRTNADVAAYAMPYNQNVHDGSGNTTQDNQYFYQGSAAGTVPTSTWTGDTTGPRVAGGAQPPSLGSLDNGDYTSTKWVPTPSANQKTLSLPALEQYWKAGTMQYTGSNPPPAQTSLPTKPTIACTTCNGSQIQAGGTPVLSATSTDADGDQLDYQFVVKDSAGAVVSQGSVGPLASGQAATWSVPGLTVGTTYTYQATVYDLYGAAGPASATQNFQYAAQGVTLRGAASTDASTGSRNYLSIAKPSGAATGDLLVAEVTVTNDSTVSTPSGWTVLSGWPKTEGTQTYATKQYLFTHRVAAGEAGPYQFDTDGPGGYVRAVGLIEAAADVSTSTAIGTRSAVQTGGTSVGVTSQAVASGTLVLGLASLTDGFSTPTTITEAAPMGSTQNVSEAQYDSAVASATNVAVGTSPVIQFSFSQSSQAVATVLTLPAA